MHSMGMIIYEVSIPQYESGRTVDVAPGFDGQNPVLRLQ